MAPEDHILPLSVQDSDISHSVFVTSANTIALSPTQLTSSLPNRNLILPYSLPTFHPTIDPNMYDSMNSPLLHYTEAPFLNNQVHEDPLGNHLATVTLFPEEFENFTAIPYFPLEPSEYFFPQSFPEVPSEPYSNIPEASSRSSVSTGKRKRKR